jgi:hypothetical protein
MPLEENIEAALEITEKEGKQDRKNVYRPILRALPVIIKGLKEKDIWIPLSPLARLEIQGKMDEPRHDLVRAQVVHFLKRANRYKKVYFRLMERSRNHFERMMKKRGLYQPQMKEFRALNVNLPMAIIFRKGKKAWTYSFEQYLPEIVYRSDKKRAKPLSGPEVYNEIKKIVTKDLDEMEKFRRISLKFAKVLRADVKLANKSPTIPYRSWHKQTRDRDDEDGIDYFIYKVKTKPKITEAET